MPHAPDLAGCALDGRYELHELIGEGAFGRVYRGLDRRLARPVAVKVIKPWWAEDPDWALNFEREAQLLARVNDPGIVQIFDVGQAAEGLYYVAELVDGESLADRLRRGPIAPRAAREIAEQLCRALAQAHAQNVVHRDVKPANVLISAHGRVKVGDFGVALLAEGSTDGGSATVVGTPRYMAPEQAQGRPATPATDVYSVGIVLYEMLAGEPPFTGTSVASLALAHVGDAPAPLGPAAPPALDRVVARALAKDPAARYEDAGAMADALSEAGAVSVVGDPRRARSLFAPDSERGGGNRGGTDQGSAGNGTTGRGAAGHSGAENGGADNGGTASGGTENGGAEGGGSEGGGTASGGTEGGGSGGGGTATLVPPPTRHSRPTERIADRSRSGVAARVDAARRSQADAARRPGADPGLRSQAGASASRRGGGRVPPTRVAPRPTPRRNVNPAARRRTAAAFGLVLTLLAGMILTVVLTSRHSHVRVPRLTGLSRAATSTRAAHVGLHPKFSSRFDKAPRGTVIGQAPRPGATVNSGSTVRVTLSAGPPPVPVPKVVGESAADAQTALQSVGLRSTTTHVPAAGATPGTVQKQDPPAKKAIPPGSWVTLSVAETPHWRALTSFSGENAGHSVPFQIRGTRWRVVYNMSYDGTCALIFICQGPHMHIAALRGGSTAPGFDLTDGDNQVQTYASGAGVYQIHISAGADNARWSVQVEDYY